MDLLERDHVWQELQRLLAQARVGHGCLLLLGGEAGIGKTALLDTALARGTSSASRAFAIGRGQCPPHFGRGYPFLPVIAALDG